MRLIQDAAKRSHGHFVLPRNNCGVDDRSARASEFYVAPLLRNLSEASRLQPPFYFPKRLRAKPPQLQPRSAGSWAVSSPGEVRSRDRVPRADCQVLHLPSRPDWLHRSPDTAQRTNRLLSKPLPQTGASCAHCRINRQHLLLLCHRLRSPYTLENVACFVGCDKRFLRGFSK